MHFLTEKLWFPPVSDADKDGMLCIGGDLSVSRLKLAYSSGIFPWFDDSQPIIWWSPDPRMVLFPEKLRVTKSLARKISQEIFTVTFNKAFEEVIRLCAKVFRKQQAGTWITDDMIVAYTALHREGFARSVEVWKAGELVGGLYGIDLNASGIFCGESMFSLESDASKVALYWLVQDLKTRDYHFIDCQLYTDHLHRLGAEEIPRDSFLNYLTS